MGKTIRRRLRDPASWLPLPASASPRNLGQHFFILLCISNLPLARYQLSPPFSRQKRGFKRRNATQWKNGWRGEGGEEASQGKGRRMNDDGSDVKAKLLLAQQQW